MQMLYDSEAFVVVHMNAHEADDDLNMHNRGKMARHGFEIVDKRVNREVYLDGSWADTFQKQINAWNADTPTQEEVDAILETYAELAHTPLIMH